MEVVNECDTVLNFLVKAKHRDRWTLAVNSSHSDLRLCVAARHDQMEGDLPIHTVTGCVEACSSGKCGANRRIATHDGDRGCERKQCTYLNYWRSESS